MRFEPLLDWNILTFMLEGLGTAMQVAAISITLSLIIGMLLAMGRLSTFAPLRWFAGTVIELIRALPVLMLIFYAFFVLPNLLPVKLNIFAASVVGLTAYTSVVAAEIIRAGILSIEKGQVEAARSLGLSYMRTMQHIVLPQALRRMTPALVSQLITLIKDTSLATVIGLDELMKRSRNVYTQFQNPLETFLLAALFYFVICYGLSLLTRRLEQVRV